VGGPKERVTLEISNSTRARERKPKNSGRPRGDHNFCKNERNKEKPQATGGQHGASPFLMGGTCDGEGKTPHSRR
jgi:hypothetical protein